LPFSILHYRTEKGELRAMKQFSHHRQPYGTLVIADATWTPIVAEEGDAQYVKNCAEKGYGVVTGIVTEGSTTNRLFHHTSTTSEVGKDHSVWAVSPEEWARGSKITVAM
jgi:hypothetical protein